MARVRENEEKVFPLVVFYTGNNIAVSGGSEQEKKGVDLQR